MVYEVVRNKTGDIRPSLLPPPQNISDIIEQEQNATPPPGTKPAQIGENTSFPLKLPSGFQISIFAKDLGKPRDLEFTANGTLLASIPSQGKVVALPDKNQDGRADEVKTLISDLNQPHGLAFNQGKLYVAEETKLVRYNWDETNVTVSKDKELFQLPGGGNHVTRSLVFNKKGQLFVTLGSTCNVCYEKHEWLAAVIVSDADGVSPRLYAKGLRNSVFLTVNPETDEVWAADMGRDHLGDNLPPEEINIIRDGRDYGWPICYGQKIHDTNFDKNQNVLDPCLRTEAPIYEFQAHAAPLGLTFINSPQFPTDWQGDLLVAYHGSWNRSVPTGYKVVKMNVSGNTITSDEDFLSGFLQGTQALGRPVDLIFDSQGSLYISDDKAGVVYKIVRSF